jgi:hypothetical protein
VAPRGRTRRVGEVATQGPESHGEGFCFGPDGLFVVKEKKPAAILEFGLAGQASTGEPRPGHWTPPGSGALHALAWLPIDLEDVSDVCVGQGIVWLLSDKPRCVRNFDGPAISLPAGIEEPEGLDRKAQGFGWWPRMIRTVSTLCAS